MDNAAFQKARDLRDGELLAQWRATEAYDAWKRAYDKLLANAAHDVLTATLETFLVYKGNYHGIQRVGDIVDQAIRDADAWRQHG